MNKAFTTIIRIQAAYKNYFDNGYCIWQLLIGQVITFQMLSSKIMSIGVDQKKTGQMNHKVLLTCYALYKSSCS